MHLKDIPNANLFDLECSIYQLAKIYFGETILLEEHFRSVPAIIEYCNRLSYGGRIQPLREAGSSNIQPPARSLYIEDGRKDKHKVNIAEAQVVVEEIIEMTKDEMYQNKSIGVISLLGEEQARQIDDMLRSKLTIREYREKSIACGTPPQFQGDERDIIFLTLVDGPGDDMEKLNLKGIGANEATKKRYNVAVSRARD